MDSHSPSDEIRQYLSLVFEWGWLLILMTVLAGVVAYSWSVRLNPIYQASAKILINQAPATRSADYASVMTSQRLTQTYAQIITTKRVLETVIDDLDLTYSSETLRKAIQVEPVIDTQLIQVYLEDENPEIAVDTLNHLVDVFIEQNRSMQEGRFSESKNNLSNQLEQIGTQMREANQELDQLENQAEDQAERARIEASIAEYRQVYSSLLLSFEQVRLAEVQSTSSLIPVERAVVPTSPIRPRILLNTIAASLAGLILGIGIAYIIQALDDSIKSADDIHKHLGLPVLGFVARYEEGMKLITATEPRSPIAEAFRSLRTNLQFASVDHPIRTILVTSPSPSDGKSTIAANLSTVIAQGGFKVTLLDGDLRRPNIHKVLGIANRLGLSTLFVQPDLEITDILQESKIEGLSVLTAGEIPPNPSELLGSEKFISILENIKERTDIVVIDSPPVMAVTDSAVLAPRVDGVLLVIKPGTTNLAASKQAVEQLNHVGANILGVVLNELEVSRARSKYYHYNGYYYAYHYYDQENGSKSRWGKKNGASLRREKTS